MNLRAFLNLLVLASLLLALAGCASSPRSGGGADMEDATVGDAVVPDPNKPRLFFSGGDVQQVRGAALGAAVTQGWKVQETSGDSLILTRNLDSSAAEALAPGASRGPLPPIVEVRADFFPRGGGVETQLGAQVITQRGTPKETRQDYTDAYRNELTHSLAMLQNAWHETGPRIAHALPPTGGFQDGAAPTEGQVADASTPASAANGFTGQNEAEFATNPSSNYGSSTVAATDYEPEVEADAETMTNEQPEFSSAATWALPAGAAATAAAAAQARASSLSPAPAAAPTAKVGGPAPVVSRVPAANPRLIQTPAPPTRMVSAPPQTLATKGLGGTSAANRGGQSAAASSPTTKVGSVPVTKPAKATPTASKTTTISSSAVTAKPAAKTTATAKTAPAANTKTPGTATKTAANSATASSSGAKTKIPTTANTNVTKTQKTTGTPASAGTAGKAPAEASAKAATKTAPVNQQPAKPATTNAKTASVSGTTSTKKANTSGTSSASKTTATTTGAKKTNSAKEN